VEYFKALVLFTDLQKHENIGSRNSIRIPLECYSETLS